jgi:hypothetical protein
MNKKRKKKNAIPCVAQVVKRPPYKHEALSSNSVLPKKSSKSCMTQTLPDFLLPAVSLSLVGVGEGGENSHQHLFSDLGSGFSFGDVRIRVSYWQAHCSLLCWSLLFLKCVYGISAFWTMPSASCHRDLSWSSLGACGYPRWTTWASPSPGRPLIVLTYIRASWLTVGLFANEPIVCLKYTLKVHLICLHLLFINYPV